MYNFDKKISVVLESMDFSYPITWIDSVKSAWGNPNAFNRKCVFTTKNGIEYLIEFKFTKSPVTFFRRTPKLSLEVEFKILKKGHQEYGATGDKDQFNVIGTVYNACSVIVKLYRPTVIEILSSDDKVSRSKVYYRLSNRLAKSFGYSVSSELDGTFITLTKVK